MSSDVVKSTKRDLSRETAQAQQLRYAIHALRSIGEGRHGPVHFAALSVKHFLGGTQLESSPQKVSNAQMEALSQFICEDMGYPFN